jgi:hypothetical protein
LIPFLKLRSTYTELKAEIDVVVTRTLDIDPGDEVLVPANTTATRRISRRREIFVTVMGCAWWKTPRRRMVLAQGHPESQAVMRHKPGGDCQSHHLVP